MHYQPTYAWLQFETTTPLGELSPECDLTLSIYAQDEQYFMAEPSFESVGGCDGFLNKDVVPGVLGRCAQCNYENFQVLLPPFPFFNLCVCAMALFVDYGFEYLNWQLHT